MTDLGRTTVPRLTAHEIRIVATDSLCLSAIFFNSGSEWRGESEISTTRRSGTGHTGRTERGVSLEKDVLGVAVLFELVLRAEWV